MAGKDYYNILGVSRTATDKDIKAGLPASGAPISSGC